MKPRIAIVSNLYPPHILGGYEILCEQVARRLLDRGWDVRVLTTDHGLSDSDERTGVVNGVRVDRLLKLFLPFGEAPVIDRAHRNRLTTENRKTTKEWLNEFKPDLMFVWSLLRATVGPVRAAMDMSIPLAFTFNDTNIESYAASSWSRPHKAVSDQMLYRDATLDGIPLDYSTCISEVVRQDLKAKLGTGFDAKVIHQGVPLEDLPKKACVGSAHQPFRLLYAGQLHDYKGVMDAVVAVNRFGNSVELRIAGAGDAEFEQKLKEAAGGHVRFLGRLDRSDLVAQYHWADALIFPSVWREPFGLTHLEAMACGTPVISTANGGQGEFLVDGKNALVVSPSRPNEIEAAINQLITNDDLRVSLANEGMGLARTRYSIDRYVDDLESWLLGRVA